MATLEQVEKLREKMNCTYEEASEAFEASNDDMLGAIIYLERQGRAGASGGSYSTKRPEEESGRANYSTQSGQADSGESFGSVCGRFFRWIGKWIKRGNSNYIEVVHRGDAIISLPITVLVLLLLFAFWITIPLMVVGLFCGAHYRFCGKDFGDTRVNDYMDAAKRAADDIKSEVRSEMGKDR